MQFKNIILLLVIIFSVCAQAGETRVVHACGTHWPPFTYVEKDKITKGISFEIYSEAFKRLNIRFEAEGLPWARCLLYVEKGQYDAILDNNVPSQNLINGVNPTSTYPVAIYVREDFPATELSWDALRGKKLGLVNGYGYPEPIKNNISGFIPDESISDTIMIRKLKMKRYDYMVSDMFSVSPLTKQEGVNVKMLKPLLSADNLYLSFNKDHVELMHQFDDVLAQMIKDGTVNKLYKNYLPNTYSEVIKLHEEFAK